MGFFDKLKGGIKEERPEAPKEKINRKAAAKPIKIKPAAAKKKEVVVEEEKPAEKVEKKEETEQSEGELAIDVYETDSDFIIQSTIAGVKPEDLDVTIENDIVTIRGSRQKQVIENTKKSYYQECYWGSFSRQVILPEEVDGTNSEASLKDGVLTLKIPKVPKVQKHKIKVA